jgi:hypothetical protein
MLRRRALEVVGPAHGEPVAQDDAVSNVESVQIILPGQYD